MAISSVDYVALSGVPDERESTMVRGDDDGTLDSPSYHALREAGLLVFRFRIRSPNDIQSWPANSNPARNCLASSLCCLHPCVARTAVNAGELGTLEDGRGNFAFLGPGNHCYASCFYNVRGKVRITDREIINGDRGIITIQQGYIGECEDRGQTLLLPPGMHQWRSATLRYIRSVDLNEPVLRMGPYTLVTVDEGYAGITQENGRMVVLGGGRTYMLKHRNHKFEVFISLKIETDSLPKFRAATADNVVIEVSATVNWRVKDAETAARMAAETMGKKVGNAHQFDNTKLRNDVLKQAEASLSAFVAMVQYSSAYGVAAGVQSQESTISSTDGASPPIAPAVKLPRSSCVENMPEASPLFDFERLNNMVSHANEVTQRYGVEIFSVNIISAFPSDENLMQSLAKGAVAAAEAQQAETAARGKSKAAQIEADGEAKSVVILSRAKAQAAQIEAEGARAAADDLSANPVAVELARVDRVGAAFGGEKASYFFGSDPHTLASGLAQVGTTALAASTLTTNR